MSAAESRDQERLLRAERGTVFKAGGLARAKAERQPGLGREGEPGSSEMRQARG